MWTRKGTLTLLLQMLAVAIAKLYMQIVQFQRMNNLKNVTVFDFSMCHIHFVVFLFMCLTEKSRKETVQEKKLSIPTVSGLSGLLFDVNTSYTWKLCDSCTF